MRLHASMGRVPRLLIGGMCVPLLCASFLAPAQSSAAEDDCAPIASDAAPSVLDAYRMVSSDAVTDPDNDANRERTVKLRDTIGVKVLHLDSLLRQQQCEAKSGPRKNIVLYLDDRPVTGGVADPPLDPASGVLAFPLKRTEASRDVWTYLLGKPGWGSRKTRVSVGLEDRYAIPSQADVELIVLPPGWFFVWLVVLIALLISFFLLASRSDVLRDGNPSVELAARKPWSLSKAQAAWWFFLVLTSYLFIGLVTGDYSTSITGTVLVLLGIAAGTTISAVAIDRSKQTPDQVALEEAARLKLESDIKTLGNDVKTLKAAHRTPEQLAELNKAQSGLIAKQSQLRKLNGESENLALDILSDANGVSFHRFQVAAWTMILGVVFVVEVFRELAMPQFSETLLGLMGLSAGTYVALKVPEANVPK